MENTCNSCKKKQQNVVVFYSLVIKCSKQLLVNRLTCSGCRSNQELARMCFVVCKQPCGWLGVQHQSMSNSAFISHECIHPSTLGRFPHWFSQPYFSFLYVTYVWVKIEDADRLGNNLLFYDKSTASSFLHSVPLLHVSSPLGVSCISIKPVVGLRAFNRSSPPLKWSVYQCKWNSGNSLDRQRIKRYGLVGYSGLIRFKVNPEM